jgi:RNA-binding protein 25
LAPAPATRPAVAAKPALALRRPAPQPVFADDDEEAEEPRRQLVPLSYSEAELREEAAASIPMPPAAAQPAAPAADGAAAAALRRRLMAAIPKDREAVFAHAVRWAEYDRAPADVRARVAGWVGKKIRELLGQEEPSFCEFILEQVALHAPAAAMLARLQDVLDEDAGAFVTKLFQVLIFETEKCAAAAD